MVGRSLSFSLASLLCSPASRPRGERRRRRAKWKGKGPDGSKAQPRCLGLGGLDLLPSHPKRRPFFYSTPVEEAAGTKRSIPLRPVLPVAASNRAEFASSFQPACPDSRRGRGIAGMHARDTPCSRTFRRDAIREKAGRKKAPSGPRRIEIVRSAGTGLT